MSPPRRRARSSLPHQTILGNLGGCSPSRPPAYASPTGLPFPGSPSLTRSSAELFSASSSTPVMTRWTRETEGVPAIQSLRTRPSFISCVSPLIFQIKSILSSSPLSYHAALIFCYKGPSTDSKIFCPTSFIPDALDSVDPIGLDRPTPTLYSLPDFARLGGSFVGFGYAPL